MPQSETILRKDDTHMDLEKCFKMSQPKNDKKIAEVPQVPKVEKIVEVTVPQFVEKFDEVSVPQVVEKIISVPFIEVVKKMIEMVVDVPVTQIQTIEKSIEPPVMVMKNDEATMIERYPVDGSVAAQLMEFPFRSLKKGDRYREIFGLATPTPIIRRGIIVQDGHDRFADQYRVFRDGRDDDQWQDKSKCWPDSAG